MSKIIIFSTHWLEGKEFQQSIFDREDVRPLPNHPTSDYIYKLVSLQDFIKQEKSDGLVSILGIGNDKKGLNKMIKITNKIIETSADLCLSKTQIKIFKNDINTQNLDYLIQDLFDLLKKKNVRTNVKLVEILSDFIPQLPTPLCYKYDSTNGYSFVAINNLICKQSGVLFREQWSMSLIEDFSQENDEVILALHGSTDWNNAQTGYMPAFSKELSEKTNREIAVHVFKHVDYDYISQTIKMKNETIENIWNIIKAHER